MLKVSRRMFGQILVSEGIIEKEQLNEALEHQRSSGEPLGELLLAQSIISEVEIVRVLSIQYQLPFMRPGDYELDTELLHTFSGDLLYHHRMIPLDRIGDCCVFAIAEIPSEEFQMKLKQKLECDLEFFFAPLSEIERLLRDEFALTQDDMMRIDKQRRRVSKGETSEPTTNEMSTTDEDSWESIFDEAEKNL